MFNSLTGDKRFLEMYERRKGDENDMACIALDYLAAEYAAKSFREGETFGAEKTKIANALTMFADNFSVDKVAKYSHLSLEEATNIGRKHGYIP